MTPQPGQQPPSPKDRTPREALEDLAKAAAKIYYLTAATPGGQRTLNPDRRS
jgi:hypothetical protein